MGFTFREWLGAALCAVLIVGALWAMYVIGWVAFG